MENKLIATIITASIGLILIGTLLAPVVATTQSQVEGSHYNGNNEYCVRMSYGTPEGNLLFHKPAGEMYVECYMGDAEEPYYIAPLNSVAQMGWVFCSSSYSLGITGYGPQPLDSTYTYNNQGGGSYSAVADEKYVSVNVTTGKIITWVDDPDNTWAYYDNCDVDKLFWADPNGDYINVQVKESNNIQIESTKAIAGSSHTQGTYIFYTNTDDVVSSGNRAATVSTETTELDNGLYQLTKVPMTITGSDDSVNNVTSGHVIVEYKVYGDPLPGSESISLLSVIPVLFIVALMLGLIGMAFFRKE